VIRSGAYLFPAHGGGRMSHDNVRRMLEETVAAADTLCLSGDLPPLGHITPHSLRRTNISLLAAGGADRAWIMSRSVTPTPS
jgi:integrase